MVLMMGEQFSILKQFYLVIEAEDFKKVNSAVALNGLQSCWQRFPNSTNPPNPSEGGSRTQFTWQNSEGFTSLVSWNLCSI